MKWSLQKTRFQLDDLVTAGQCPDGGRSIASALVNDLVTT